MHMIFNKFWCYFLKFQKYFGAKKLIFMKSLLILIRASRKVLKNFKIDGFLLIFSLSTRKNRPNFMLNAFFFNFFKGGPFSLKREKKDERVPQGIFWCWIQSCNKLAISYRNTRKRATEPYSHCQKNSPITQKFWVIPKTQTSKRQKIWLWLETQIMGRN